MWRLGQLVRSPEISWYLVLVDLAVHLSPSLLCGSTKKALPPIRTLVAFASSQSSASGGPTALYHERVNAGDLRRDDHQLGIVQDLQRLYNGILSYRPPPVPEPLAALPPPSRRSGFLSNLFGNRDVTPPIPDIPEDVPRSLYLFGDVGCGKTMLMDLLYESLPNNLGKRRVHFHAFMIDVHKRLHQLAAHTEAMKGDAIIPVARQLARDGRILCFDEFQVVDIADAMILRRLLESLIGYGYVIVITSNRTPNDLYKNGIQRESFIPCINLINSHFDVRDLDSPIDYRKLPRALSKVYYHPQTQEHRLEYNKVFEGLTDGEAITSNRQLDVWGRKLVIPQSTSKVASFTFSELCGHPLSAADYLEIVKKFETVFIENIPRLSANERDQARRFILFIDAAYDSKTKLLTLSEVPITQIFSDKPTRISEEYSAHQRAMMDDLGLNARTVGASSIFTGDEEIFAFARAVSRLSEMGTRAWAERVKHA
ncbi:MAG: hypothetical protein CYPHOPRED_004089 [Cyphobasidiales sp. Tagirdzhanova-0007]|nr:MAG: hypothetical protein CYPHOPRED_004089 [Cyphobasidiales sp. Tagirdzhanova-0007]